MMQSKKEGVVDTPEVNPQDFSPKYSRWRSSASGNTLVVIARHWRPEGMLAVTILDLVNEHAADVRWDDWKRWVDDKKVTRIEK